MEGQGVTNYDVDKPSYAFSSATTEFDDALMRRGVITMEQAIMAKGASAQEAHRLAAQARSENTANFSQKKERDTDSDEDSDFEDDDGFMQKYRRQRLAELKRENTTMSQNSAFQPTFGEVIPIQRPEWTHHVNDGSKDAWVVVALTSNNAELTGSLEAAITNLATACPSVKFVTISSTSAIANWPDSNLPSIFVYRHGKMTQELVRMRRVWKPRGLLDELKSAGVEFATNEVQQVYHHDKQHYREKQQILRRKMVYADDEEDDDEVI